MISIHHVAIWYLWLPCVVNVKALCFHEYLWVFNFSEIYYVYGLVIMSKFKIWNFCPSVCRQIKWTSTKKVTNLLLIVLHIWIMQDVEWKVFEDIFWKFWKKYGLETQIPKIYLNSESYELAILFTLHN